MKFKIIEDYLGREQCNSIKGIFILFVFFSHFMGYVGQADGYAIDTHLGQMMVTLFLFYSGYGVMESIKKKGDEYVKSMPKRRVLTTLINFDIAVLAFVVLDLVLGRPITLKQTLLSFICWESVGNSNWYIFAIVSSYLTAFLACYKAQFRKWGGVISLVLLAGYAVIMSYCKGIWWYDTILCFPIGMMYSQYKSYIETFVARFYWPLIVFVLLVYLGIRFGVKRVRISDFGLIPNAMAIAFAFFVILLTMKFPFRFKALSWCGQNLFPLYIYQRIPMLIFFTLDPTGFVTWRMPLYFAVSFVITIFIALLYPKWQIQFNRRSMGASAAHIKDMGDVK